MSVYEVTHGTYRNHRRGERFEATLDVFAERRAIRRGSIRVVEESTPRLVEGSYTLPKRDGGGGRNA